MVITVDHFLLQLRGTRQGSRLSPALFNILIDDLLVKLSSKSDGVSIGTCHFNNFADNMLMTLLFCVQLFLVYSA